ncbi:MAG: mechanosensitive ion channel [Campylobacterota bacterium]|nr:mechanosensitive ion channel [Campylobacterota bacterium]
MIFRYLLLAFFLAVSLFAAGDASANTSPKTEKSKKQRSGSDKNATKEAKKVLSSNEKYLIEQLLLRKTKLDEELKQNNIWSKIYSNYHTYLFLKQEKGLIDAKISLLEKKKRLTKEEKKKLLQYKKDQKTIMGKLQLLEEYEKDPFKKLLKPEPIEDIPSVENPLAIVSAVSFQKKLLSQQEEYNARYQSLKQIVYKFQEEKKILEELIRRDKENVHYKIKLNNINERLKIFSPVLEIFETTQGVYIKKIDETKLKLSSDIKREMEKAATIGGVILFFLLLFLLGKHLAKRYMSDNERFYTINKILNISFITMLVIILLFSYIENVSYLVTVLGFASAGIAIAMKDWFMSVMGWFVIVIGGTIHVGDRVKFVRGGIEYVGDIVDISMLRMTLHEDVTLTTYALNRRSGRIIFIPNNFVFTDMIANYSHAGLKTVWDGIDFVITFDSNVHKATSIAKEVSKKYSKGYTDITRKQLNKLRSNYSIRNTNVEPRIFSFIEPYGMKISTWYLTNAYATLTLRSTISNEIIERIQAEKDIFLAFPTQSLYLDKDVRKPSLSLEDSEPDNRTQH